MYIADVEETRELPDVPQDAALLEYLREQASPPSGPDGYALGTDWLAARIDQLPPGAEIEDDLPPEWLSFARDGGHILSPVQDRLSSGDIGPRCASWAPQPSPTLPALPQRRSNVT
jgi:hypothetical protein